MEGTTSSARVVIVGGGIGGVSVAYHLAALGLTDVVLVERAQLSSGTTWHSTGNMETYRADPLIFEMVRYAAELYPKVADAAARDIAWRVVGRVMYTDREDRWEEMRTLPGLGRARGIEIDLLKPAALRRRLPIIAEEGLLGGIWVPGDARVNPTDAVDAFARIARSRGVSIRARCAVEQIALRDGAVRGVVTSRGEIACETVVLAAGLWSADVALSCGARLPLHALEHQYLITQPFGVGRNLPLFLSFDDQLYGREEVGGLIVGSLDDRAIPISTEELPRDFASSLLSERWEQFEPYLATAMRRFPALKTAPVKMLLNGPESFTPDGHMLLGPVPGVAGLFAACGFNSNGMALAPAAGRYVAEWIVEGAPSADVAPLDVRRFSCVQSRPDYVRERVTEIPGYHCRMHTPEDDYATARNLRRTPLYEELARDGARFSSINGWERALWLEPRSDPAAARPAWLGIVADEVAAAAHGTLLVDRSADAKYAVLGEGALRWIEDQIRPFRRGDPSEALLAPLPGPYGEVAALVRVLERNADRCLLIAGPDQETHLAEWLRLCLPSRLRAQDETSAIACLELRGPRRHSGIKRATRNGGARAFEDPLNGSTLLLIESDLAREAWRELLAQGEESGLRAGGHLAEEAIRIALGVPAFAREIGLGTLGDELGGPALSACRAVPRTHRRCRLAAFSSAMPRLGFGNRDVILEHGRVVGEMVSCVRLPGWDAALALGRLYTDEKPGISLQTPADGELWPLVRREIAWHAALEGSRQ
jgi:4-methylaminobutanoate oxidase (formaldehyde-forming)